MFLTFNPCRIPSLGRKNKAQNGKPAPPGFEQLREMPGFGTPDFPAMAVQNLFWWSMTDSELLDFF